MRDLQRQFYSAASRALFSIALLASGPSLLAQKITLAIVDFEGFGISRTEAIAITNRLRNEIFQLGSYKVVERGMMESIIAEQDFQMTGCTSEECLVELGQIIGAEQIVGGSISKIGDILTVSGRIIDVATAEVLNATDYDHRGTIDDLLIDGTKIIAARISEFGETVPNSEMEVITDVQYVQIYREALGLYRKKKYSDAIIQFRRLVSSNIDRKKKGSFYHWLGICYYDMGQYACAIQEFEKVFFYPVKNYSVTRQMLGLSYFNSGNYNEAIHQFQRVLTEYPDSESCPGSHYFIGLSYMELGNYSAAKQEFQILRKKYPKSSDAKLAKHQLRLSKLKQN